MSNLKNNKAICLYFQVHQPFRLKRYRFFNLGSDHYYYDDFNNESIMRKWLKMLSADQRSIT